LAWVLQHCFTGVVILWASDIALINKFLAFHSEDFAGQAWPLPAQEGYHKKD
jgi:hypothetical protein